MHLAGSQFNTELIVSIILIGVLLIFLYPSALLMPETLQAMLMLVLITVFLAFLGLIWKEQAYDERDDFHRLHAGRFSFLAGATILVIGILIQNFNHDVDPWLVATLIIMILVKVAARVYSEIKK